MPTFSEFENRIINHAREHQRGLQLTTALSSCDRCYPLTVFTPISDQFQHFWYWIEHNSFAQSYTSCTLSVFDTYCYVFTTAVENRKNIINSAASNVLESITFSTKPNLSLDEFIILLRLVTQKTNNFTQDVTVGINKQAKKELQQPKPVNMGINRDEMKALFDATFGADGAKLKDKVNVKIADFYGTDDKDPIA